MKFRHLHSQLVLASTVSIRPRRSRTKAASAARRGIKLARKPKLTEHQQREGDPPARPIDSLAPLAGRGSGWGASRRAGRIAASRGKNERRAERAQPLRRALTPAEFALWSRIRSRQLGGCKFVRQEPIGRYYVDFVCRDRHLIVELDGGQHAGRPEDGQARQRALRPWLSRDPLLEQRCHQPRWGSRNDRVRTRKMAPHPTLSPQAGRGTSRRRQVVLV